jgi:hypothetical protein
MVLEKLSKRLHCQLEAQMEEISSITDSLEKLRTSLGYVQKALAEIKIALNQNGFVDEEEEIWFFKYGKPRIYSWLIFVTERYAIENSLPMVGKELQISHFNSQLVFIDRFFRQNEFLYQYYRLDARELDDRYFKRGEQHVVMGFYEVPEVDPSFSTVADYLFSKFMGYEMLQKYLLDEIEMRSTVEGEVSKMLGKEIKWTGESVNIIELIYGIYETGQVNDGKASLNELMDFFGQALQINLTKYFKRFSDIKRRKSMSKTRFLDEMQQVVAKRIEDSDAWIPEGQRARYGY